LGLGVGVGVGVGLGFRRCALACAELRRMIVSSVRAVTGSVRPLPSSTLARRSA